MKLIKIIKVDIVKMNYWCYIIAINIIYHVFYNKKKRMEE